jgi:hypothetical protein
MWELVEGAGRRERILRVEEKKICFLCTYEDSMM